MQYLEIPTIPVTPQYIESTTFLRPDVEVLRQLNIAVKAGQKVALVGESGCGKSTVIQLLQRYVDCCDQCWQPPNPDFFFVQGEI